MIIGIPKEIKTEEYRVGLTPLSVYEVIKNGHQVLVEHNAGKGIGFTDADYQQFGAVILKNPAEIYARAELIVKVKEPQPQEYALIRAGQILFTYLHLAPDRVQTEALIKSNCIAIAYETVTSSYGDLPLLTPMSEVAGRLSIQAGARCLEKPQGGSGVLLSGVPGVNPGRVVVIGGGVVGTNAMRIALGGNAHVAVLDNVLHRLRTLDMQFAGNVETYYATAATIEEQIASADLVIGAVLVPGKAAPKLVTRNMLKNMRQGSVLVDVAIDQGGCFETSKPTTHKDPSFVVDGIVHYCVTNMPGAVPRTSTLALNNATLPFVLALANKGYKQALAEDSHFRNGLNIYQGHVTYRAVADDLGYDYVPAEAFLQ